MMTWPKVRAVLDALEVAGCPHWVGGGWGVDALVGRATRKHRDLDLALPADRERAALETLAGLGYGIETDWRPVRVELVEADGGRVDVHPVLFDASGDGRQADLDGGWFHYPRDGFTTGVLDGRSVPCLSVEQQLALHTGYEPRGEDVMDLRRLYELIAEPVTVEGLIAAAGQPVDATTLGLDEVRRAAGEGRVVVVHRWSTLGDREAFFSYAIKITDREGHLVFPRPIPVTMRTGGREDWTDTDEVYAAFGL
jgi:lincosamide nucleotidyltransferase A/C/D/E